MKTKIYRQGDVLIVAVESMPKGALVKREDGSVVLAHGEVTGHSHRIPSRHAKLYRTEEDARFLRVEGSAPVALLHEEHAPVNLPPGNYRVIIHAEYQPSALPRQVAD